MGDLRHTLGRLHSELEKTPIENSLDINLSAGGTGVARYGDCLAIDVNINKSRVVKKWNDEQVP